MRTFACCVFVLGAASLASAQAGRGAPPPAQSTSAPGTTTTTAPPVAVAPTLPAGVTPPADYLIGANDQLSIVFWRDKEMTSDVAVRPDGKISLPLLNDIQAAGLTTDQLRLAITEAATKLMEDPTVSIVVKQINSRNVYVVGMVNKPGPYPMMDRMTVLQLLTLAGGVQEYAKSDKIMILRTDKGVQRSIPFNYKDLLKGKNLKQNIELVPGDSVVVP